MVALALDVVEAFTLLHPRERDFFHPILGVVPPPSFDPNKSLRIMQDTKDKLIASEYFNEKLFDFMLELLDNTDIEFQTRIIRPYDEIEEIDTSNFPKEFFEWSLHHSLPRFHSISAIIGKATDQYYTIIRDGALFYLIADTIKLGTFHQIIELFEHALGREEPHIFQPINISQEVANSLAVDIADPLPKVKSEHGVSAKNAGILNEFLAEKNVQKATVVVVTRDYSHPISSSRGLGVVDFEGKGRILSRPYTSFDGTNWLKFTPGSNKDLEIALLELCTAIGVDWYTYRR